LRKLSVLFLLAGLALVLAAALQQGALGLATDTFSNGSNAFTADTLNPATSLSATGGASISLSWTATSDTYASGYHVLRSTTSGSGYSQIAQVTPRTTTTYVDSPGAGTYYYVVRAYYQSWESVDSNEATAGASTNTGLANCTANAAVTTNSGDNNGFETTPGNACADDANTASDANSGTGNSGSCANTGKDRHLFYNYGYFLPSGSVINGIRVRLDAWVSSASSNPNMCVDLSWDGGATWTATKSTTTLTTAEATYILGATSDTWGRTWATGDFSDANFRLRITDVASSTARTFTLDWAAVEVTYTPP
jgi:hypothetical protein